MAKTRVRDNESFEVFFAYINEVGLVEDIRIACLRHKVTIREVYLDVRGATVHAARLEIWWNLYHFGKSANEIGRIFSRDATSVSHAMKRLEEQAALMNISLDPEHVFDIARGVAAGVQKSWKETGQAVAAVTNGKKAT